jgi:hypothetical protein
MNNISLIWLAITSYWLLLGGFLLGLWINVTFKKKINKENGQIIKPSLDLTAILEKRIKQLEAMPIKFFRNKNV